MLDIKFIIENKDLVIDGARKKGIEVDIEELLKLDEKRRELLQSVESKRKEQNDANDKIASAPDEKKSEIVERMKKVKADLQKEETELRSVIEKWREVMLRVPNIPDMSVPVGKSDEDNKELKAWGEKPTFDFKPKGHIELMNDLGMVDFERGTKTHGFRGYFLKGDGALLSWAIWNYARDFFGRRDFEHFIPPTIVRKEFLYGTGHLPGDENDLYKLEDNEYLSGTAEIPMMAYHAQEILDKSELPKRYLAFSPCYRKEAGSYGKDTKGLVRVHEFFKLEQLVLCEASHAESEKFHEELNRNTEEFVESLGIPYRQLVISTGDLKGAHVKSYDTELWVPTEEKYREIASASYYHDFQTRRFNTRYRDGDKTVYAHSLNATAIPTPRVLVAIVENFQQKDGSIKIPDVLVPYFGKDTISKK